MHLGLRVWVKRGFSSAATSAFYIFKIRTSADPHFTSDRPAGLIVRYHGRRVFIDRLCPGLGLFVKTCIAS